MSETPPNQDSDEPSILGSGEMDTSKEDDEEPDAQASSTADGADDASPTEADAPASDDGDPTSDPDASDAHTDSEADGLHFEDDALATKLKEASDEELDNAPFGIIKVDDEGIVEFFNQYEAELSGMDPDEVTGRNFFTQVAPCTNNRLFRGRFKKGVRRGELDETFTYTYTYKMRPTLVDVHLFRDDEGNNWITVQKY